MPSTDIHRLFLQSLISRRCVSEKLARQLLQRSYDIVNTNGNGRVMSYDQVLSEVKDSLTPLGLDIRTMADELNGVKMVAIVNAKGDAIAQMATEYTPLEISYFKNIVDCIMLAPSESFSLSSMAALREAGNLTTGSLTKTAADTTLNNFVARGWLIKSKRGRYSLSTRCLVELQKYLTDNFEDEVLECTICMDIVTKGIACGTAACKVRMHNHCHEVHRLRNNHCPTCGPNVNWPRSFLVPVGEAAVKDGQDIQRRARREESNEEEEAEEEYADEEEEERMDDTPTQRKKSSRAKKGTEKRAIAGEFIADEAEDSDEEEGEDVEPQLTQAAEDRKKRR